MVRPTTRTQQCTRADAQTRLAQADAYLTAANFILNEAGEDEADFGVAASVAVLAGIAASDAVCCAKLRKRPRGPSHTDAVKLVETVSPDGPDMARDLKRLVARKDDAHYGLILVTEKRAHEMVTWATRLTVQAHKVVES